MSSEADSELSEGKRIARNSLLLGIGQVCAMVLGFFTTLMVIDRLGDEYGLFLGAQRFAALFIVVGEFGLNPLLVRRIATGQADPGRVLGTILALRGVLMMLFTGLVVGGAWFVDYLPEQRRLLYGFAALQVVTVFAETFTALFEGYERMGRAALLGFIRAGTTLAFVAFVLFLGDGGVEGVLVAYLVSAGLQLVVALSLIPGLRAGLKLAVDWAQAPNLLGEASQFVMIGLGYAALHSIDVVMLTQLSGAGEVARYGAAIAFVDALLLAPLVVQRALYPAFSRMSAQGTGTSTVEDSIRLFSAVLLPSAVGLALLAVPAMALYPSGQFGAAAPVLAVRALGLIPAGFDTVCATYLTGLGRLRGIIGAYAVTIPVQIAGNFWLIPDHGATGAAISAVVAETVLGVILVLLAARTGIRIPGGDFLRHTLCVAVMGAVVFVLRDWVLPVPVLAGGLVYGALLYTTAGPESIEKRLVAVLAELRR